MMMLSEKQAQEYPTRVEIAQEFEDSRKVESHGVIEGERVLMKIEFNMDKFGEYATQQAAGVLNEQIQDREIDNIEEGSKIYGERMLRKAEQKQNLHQEETLRILPLLKDISSGNEKDDESSVIGEEFAVVKQEEDEEDFQLEKSQEYKQEQTAKNAHLESLSNQQNAPLQQLGGLQQQSQKKFANSQPKYSSQCEANMQEEDEDYDDGLEEENKDESSSNNDNLNCNGYLPQNSHFQSKHPSGRLSVFTGTFGNSGRWTKEEHSRFIEGLHLFGKNWKKVEDHVGSRTGAQIRSHAQKFFNKQERVNNKKNGLLLRQLCAASSLPHVGSKYYPPQGQQFRNIYDPSRIGAGNSCISEFKKNSYNSCMESNFFQSRAEMINPRLSENQSCFQGNILTELNNQIEGCHRKYQQYENVFAEKKNVFSGNTQYLNNENERNVFPIKTNISKYTAVPSSSTSAMASQQIQQLRNQLCTNNDNIQDLFKINQCQKIKENSIEALRLRSDSSASNFTTASNSLMDQTTGASSLNETNVITSAQLLHDDSQQKRKSQDNTIVGVDDTDKITTTMEAKSLQATSTTTGSRILLPIIPLFSQTNSRSLSYNTNQHFNSLLPINQNTNSIRDAPSFFQFALNEYGESIFNYPSRIFSFNTNQQPIFQPANSLQQPNQKKQFSFRLRQEQDQTKLDYLTKKICFGYEKSHNIQGTLLQDKSSSLHNRSITHQQNLIIHGKDHILQRQDQFHKISLVGNEQETQKQPQSQDFIAQTPQTKLQDILSKLQKLILTRGVNTVPSSISGSKNNTSNFLEHQLPK